MTPRFTLMIPYRLFGITLYHLNFVFQLNKSIIQSFSCLI